MRKIALLIAAALTLAGCSTGPQVEVQDVWVKSSEMSVEGGMTAVYGTITNQGSRDVTLIGAEADVAGVVEIHEVAMIDGEMKMQQLEGGLVIPAGKSVVLEPGGNHIMLMNLTSAVVAGSTISVKLNFDGADSITLDSVLAKPSAGGDEEYHKEDHDHDH